MTFYIFRTEYPYVSTILSFILWKITKIHGIIYVLDTLKNTDGWNVRFFTKYKNAWSSHVCWSINSIRNDLFSHVYLRVHFLSIQILWDDLHMTLFDPLFQSLLTLLGQTADELLSRQIKWVKQLPFFEELQIPDYTTLISNTWWVSFLREKIISLKTLKIFKKISKF